MGPGSGQSAPTPRRGARLLGAHHPTVTCRYPLTRYPYPVSSSTSGSPTSASPCSAAVARRVACSWTQIYLRGFGWVALRRHHLCQPSSGGHDPRVQRADELVVAGHGVGETLPSRVVSAHGRQAVVDLLSSQQNGAGLVGHRGLLPGPGHAAQRWPSASMAWRGRSCGRTPSAAGPVSPAAPPEHVFGGQEHDDVLRRAHGLPVLLARQSGDVVGDGGRMGLSLFAGPGRDPGTRRGRPLASTTTCRPGQVR